jgi:hypothetical protein
VGLWVERPIEIADLIVRDGVDWVVSDLVVDGRRWPWHLWSLGTADQLAECLRRDCLWTYSDAGRMGDIHDVLEPGSRFSMSVLYVGDRERAAFQGCLVGRAPLNEDDLFVRRGLRPQLILFVSTHDRPRPRIPPGKPVLISEHLVGQPVLVESITLESPADWLVYDVLLDGKSTFDGKAITADLSMGLVGEALEELGQLGLHLGVARDRIEIVVGYVGADPEGGVFRCSVRGSPTSISPTRRTPGVPTGAGAGWDPYPD